MLISEREFRFQLYECLDTEGLLQRPRYAEHGRETFDATLDLARRLALDLFAPHYAASDAQEPQFVDGTARVMPEVARAWRAFAEAGLLRAHWNADEDGLQLPDVIQRSMMATFFCANTPTATYPFLTIGAANVLRTFGSPDLRRRYLPDLGNGRAAGTMVLTEPAQGSSLGDIRTVASPQPDGSYRLKGHKIFISGGDQDITDNIVHLVLARIEGAPPGARGISLFLVPKWLTDEAGRPLARNDVALAGLLHKMGWRGTTSTVLAFGERGGAQGWLVGVAHQGLAHMFQMMNEARINVGLTAACIAWRGFAESLAYARERVQGRLPSCKDPLSPQVPLVAHADVRRLLLAQKAYAEGSLALCLYASALFEDQHTHPSPEARARAALLLDLLTPVVKSFPSKYGCAANEMAIQVLGGAGYTRDWPLEQLYRDQRLNPIHEGAEAIHGLDLLGRKVAQDEGRAFRTFVERVTADLAAAAEVPALAPHAEALRVALAALERVSMALVVLLRPDPDLALANATPYLDAFGRVVVAWQWLRQGTAAARGLARLPDGDAGAAFFRGKLQAAAWYCRWELPQVHPVFERLAERDRTALDTHPDWLV